MKWVPDRTGRFAKRPHYLPSELDEECERIISGFLTTRHGRAEFPVRTDDLTVLIEQSADLDSYADLSVDGDSVEGVTEFYPGKRPVVRIAGRLASPHLENRLRTTLTHEFGHLHFHRFLFEDLQGQPTFSFGKVPDNGNKCHRDSIVGASERDWMEWQAGFVCGALLMPITELIARVQRFRSDNCLPYSEMTLSSDEGQRLIKEVASGFQTSNDAARVRLIKAGLLADRGQGNALQPLF